MVWENLYILWVTIVSINHTDKNASSLVNFFHTYSFCTTINVPSVTLINHIWMNNFERYNTSGIRHNSISDNFPVVAAFCVANIFRRNSIVITKIILPVNNIAASKSAITEYDCTGCVLYSDGNNAFKIYLNKFIQLYDKHFPKLSIKIKEMSCITPGIKQSI